jgi:hypothetical protein
LVLPTLSGLVWLSPLLYGNGARQDHATGRVHPFTSSPPSACFVGGTRILFERSETWRPDWTAILDALL